MSVMLNIRVTLKCDLTAVDYNLILLTCRGQGHAVKQQLVAGVGPRLGQSALTDVTSTHRLLVGWNSWIGQF